MEFKEKLKKLRSEKGVTQEKLASTVLVSRSTVAKWENGLSLPNEQSLDLLAEYFAIDKGELLSDKSIETVFVEKNIKISQITKLLICITTLCLVLIVGFVIFLFSFWARPIGGDGGVLAPENEIIGIAATVYENTDDETDNLKDNETLIENHYKLQVEKDYFFKIEAVTYGTLVNRLEAQNMTLYFDNDIISLVQIDDTAEPIYKLKIKSKCEYILLFAEGYDFTYSIIISAE